MNEEFIFQGKEVWSVSAKNSGYVESLSKMDAVGFFSKEHLQFYKHRLFSWYFLREENQKKCGKVLKN